MRRHRLRVLTSILVVLMAVQLGLITSQVGASTAKVDFPLFDCSYIGCEEACSFICNEWPYTECEGWDYHPYYTCGQYPGRCIIECWDDWQEDTVILVGCCDIIE